MTHPPIMIMDCFHQEDRQKVNYQLILDPSTVQQHSLLYCVPNRTYPLEWETDIVGHNLFHFPLRTDQGWPPLPKPWPSDWASPNKHLCQRHRTVTVGCPILLLFRRERAGVLTLQTDCIRLWRGSAEAVRVGHYLWPKHKSEKKILQAPHLKLVFKQTI